MPPPLPPSPTAAAALVHHYTRLLSAAGASSSSSSLSALLRIHARAVLLGISTNTVFATSLLAAVAPASLAHAHRVFDAAPHRDAYMWNTLLRSHAHSRSHSHAAADTLALYKRMRAAGVAPDHYTYPIVLPACAAARAPLLGRAAHGDAVRFALAGDGFVHSALIAMYCQEGEVVDAERVFAESGSARTVVSWTAMVAGYVQNCFFGEAVAVFGTMVAEGVLPNEITLISFLPCLQGQEWLAAGEMVHGFVVKLGFDANIPLVNALIAMYGKCGSVSMAEELFDGMITRTLVSWNTMVAMYEQHGDGVQAIKFFRRMLREEVGFDCVTLVSVLSACARSGALETGKWVHELARSHGLDADARIGNVLVDMYAKCGAIACAREVFDGLREPGVVSWSAMIGAYANHGEPEEALKLFSLMKGAGVRPNSFTFTAVLMACGHSGLVDQGLRHFNSIVTDYQMPPTLEHYACMVDMLGRVGSESPRGEATRAEKAGAHRQAGMAGAEGPTASAQWLDGSLLLRWPSGCGELLAVWDAVRRAAVAPALAVASGACLAMSAMLLADAVFMAVASLARRRPERRYRAGPLGGDGDHEEEDEEGGHLCYPVPMVLIQIPMYNEREVYKLSIGAVCGLSWPSDRVIVQVLDDSTDPTVQVSLKPHPLGRIVWSCILARAPLPPTPARRRPRPASTISFRGSAPPPYPGGL